MSKIKTLESLTGLGIVAVVRGNSINQAEKTVEAVIKGGIKAIELTFTVPQADKLVAKEVDKYKENSSILIGAGTVLDPVSARIAILAGAKFIVSPSLNKDVLKLCNLYAIPYIAGAQSLSEIQAAQEEGIDIIKLFPGNVATPKMVKEVIGGPLPQVNLMPTGGVSLNNMADWFSAGVVAIGTGGSLTAPAKNENYKAVTQNAHDFVNKFKEIKNK